MDKGGKIGWRGILGKQVTCIAVVLFPCKTISLNVKMMLNLCDVRQTDLTFLADESWKMRTFFVSSSKKAVA